MGGWAFILLVRFSVFRAGRDWRQWPLLCMARQGLSDGGQTREGCVLQLPQPTGDFDSWTTRPACNILACVRPRNPSVCPRLKVRVQSSGFGRGCEPSSGASGLSKTSAKWCKALQSGANCCKRRGRSAFVRIRRDEGLRAETCEEGRTTDRRTEPRGQAPWERANRARKRQRTAALQNASAHSGRTVPPGRFWSTPVLWRSSPSAEGSSGNSHVPRRVR